MEGQNCYNYILIGLNIRTLINVTADFQKEFIITVIENLTELLRNANFEVTLSYMDSIISHDILDDLKLISAADENIGEDLSSKIQRELRVIESVVFAEANTKKIYILANRRFNSDYLLNHPDKLLAEGIFEKFNHITQFDIRSACRCLLFGEATAAAFHILRATEGVLKSYYYHHQKRNRLTKPMWANMIEQLKGKTKNKPPETLLSSLDLIRSAYRNPTQHPEAIYDIDKTQDLFGVCLDVIGKMGSEI